jgi:branched-subunit amino acid aminotransferase/4-amino-4-deoxychorismate lyase
MEAATPRVEVEGRPIEREPSLDGAIGHFTAMQVRGGATRGLGLHLRRLEAANREMFGIGLDRDRVRELVRHALDGTSDASVRVYVRRPEDGADPVTVVTVKEPGGIVSPQRLRTVDYLRPTAHLKHLATEQGACTRIARDAGFDDALLTAGRDTVAEAATANMGFLEGPNVVWPDAPLLRGITMQLLDGRLAREDRSIRRPVRLSDVPAFDGAFVCNARGIADVSAIDETRLPDATAPVRALREAYAAIPWDPI